MPRKPPEPNRFPRNLEDDYARAALKIFDAFARRLLRPLGPIFREARKEERAAGRIDEIRIDAADHITPAGPLPESKIIRRADADPDFDEILLQLAAIEIPDLPAPSRNIVARHFKLLDRWAVSRLLDSVRPALRGSIGMMPSGLAVVPINVIGLPDPTAAAAVESAIARNVGLITERFAAHREGLLEVLRRGIAEGLSNRSLAESIRHETGVQRSRAEFWARDQTGSAMAELNRARHQQAGIPGYIWRTLQDEAVRENHRELEGRKFTWQQGASHTGLLTVGSHPGEDYNCRCWPEPNND